jgi:gamma-glutamylcyclotransferase (GGCT)/AIG2-like uncharacterized protein YtfP
MNLLFAYGSLKQGFGNHPKINQSPIFNATLSGFILLTQGGSFPAIKVGLGMVEGEVYEVTDAKLKVIDALEVHPDYYKRELVTVVNKTSLKPHQVFTYVIVDATQWRPYGKTNWQR